MYFSILQHRRAMGGPDLPSTGFADVRVGMNRTSPAAEAHTNRLNVLLTDIDEPWAQQLPRLLEPQGVRAIRVHHVDEAVQVIRREPIHAAVVDLALPMHGARGSVPPTGAEIGGLKLLRVIQRLEPAPPAVVVRGRRFDRDDHRLLAEALKLRAFSVVDQPVQLEQLLEVLRRLLRRYYGGTWPGMS